AVAVAGPARTLLRFCQYDRVPRRAVPVAPGSLTPRSVQDHSHPAWPVDVRAVQGGPDRGAAESPDQDDGLLHALVHDGVVLEFCVRLEPVLRGTESLQHPAAVSDCEAAPAPSAGV